MHHLSLGHFNLAPTSLRHTFFPLARQLSSFPSLFCMLMHQPSVCAGGFCFFMLAAIIIPFVCESPLGRLNCMAMGPLPNSSQHPIYVPQPFHGKHITSKKLPSFQSCSHSKRFLGGRLECTHSPLLLLNIIPTAQKRRFCLLCSCQ